MQIPEPGDEAKVPLVDLEEPQYEAQTNSYTLTTLPPDPQAGIALHLEGPPGTSFLLWEKRDQGGHPAPPMWQATSWEAPSMVLPNC